MITQNEGTPYTPKWINIYHVFTNNFFETLTSPIASYDALYYKSFYDILTFFGLWICIIILFLLFLLRLLFLPLKLFRSEQDVKITNINTNTKWIFILCVSWMVCELPTYIYLPESAIRYSFAFFIPFTIFMTLLISYTISFISYNYRKTVLGLIIIMIFAAMLTNVSYVYAFRAGWGSSFIVFEKGMDYFAENIPSRGNIGVLYASGATASEYYSLNKSSPTYELDLPIQYIMSSNAQDFSEQNLQKYAKNYTFFYVIQRTTSVSVTKIPDLPLDNYVSFTKIATINGTDNTILFDRWNMWMISFLEIPYRPNELHIYQYVPKQK